MAERTSRSSYRLLNVIGAIIIIMAVALTYLHTHVDFSTITEPFERLSSMAQEQFPGSGSSDKDKAESTSESGNSVVGTLSETAEQMRDDLGLTKAQSYYIKFKTFMENLEQRVTELPYKPLIVVALLLLFSLKSFVGIVPVSATCLIAAVIFPFPVALIINLIGVGIIFTIKYFMGRRAKSNAIKKFIMKSDNLWKVVSDADNSTKKALKESNDKRKAENEEHAKQREARRAERDKNRKPSPALQKLLQVLRSIRDTLLKVPVLSTIIDEEDAEQSAKGGTGNPIVLLALRLVPFVPANPISSLYGNMQMDYRSFLTISLIGYLIKVISFTAIGYNIADPFSSKFIVPLIILLYISGILVLGINSTLRYFENKKTPAA